MLRREKAQESRAIAMISFPREFVRVSPGLFGSLPLLLEMVAHGTMVYQVAIYTRHISGMDPTLH